MATELTRSVTRKLRATTATKHGRQCRPTEAGARPIILEIGVDEILRFRIYGTRRVVELHAIVAFQIAQVNQIQEDYKQKMEDYKFKKQHGAKNLRKPKKPFVPSILLK